MKKILTLAILAIAAFSAYAQVKVNDANNISISHSGGNLDLLGTVKLKDLANGSLTDSVLTVMSDGRIRMIPRSQLLAGLTGNYLSLAGGTLTGGLNGTTALFSDNIGIGELSSAHRLNIIGIGSTNGTSGLRVKNSDGKHSLEVFDDASVKIGHKLLGYSPSQHVNLNYIEADGGPNLYIGRDQTSGSTGYPWTSINIGGLGYQNKHSVTISGTIDLGMRTVIYQPISSSAIGNNGGALSIIRNQNSGNFGFGIDSTYRGYIQNYHAGSYYDLLLNPQGGYVGINNSNPTVAMDIIGKAKVSEAPTDPNGVVRKQDLDDAVAGIDMSAYQTLSNLSTDLTASSTKYPSVNAVNAGIAAAVAAIDLSDYLPLDGGALSGALTGTTGTFIQDGLGTTTTAGLTLRNTTVGGVQWSPSLEFIGRRIINNAAAGSRLYQETLGSGPGYLKFQQVSNYGTGGSFFDALSFGSGIIRFHNSSTGYYISLSGGGGTANRSIALPDTNLVLAGWTTTPTDGALVKWSGIKGVLADAVAGTDYVTPGILSSYLPLTGGALSGNVTADSFIKSGGTSSQFLKADGSVDNATYAPLASPALTGTPTAPTATAGTNTTQIATTAFVQTAVTLPNWIHYGSAMGLTSGYYTFLGTTSTYTLSPISGNTGKSIFIINGGSGNITLNSNAGSNDIWDNGTAISSKIIAPGSVFTLYCNGLNWVILNIH